MIVYIDTSDLVKLYAEETGSEGIKDIIQNATVISTNLKNKIRSDVCFSSNDLKLNRAAKKEGIIVL